MTRAERDRQIVARWIAGETRTAIAESFGMTPRRVSQIAAEAGARRAGQAPLQIGRPRLPDMPTDTLAHYAKVRRYCGAAYARQALGIAA